MLYYSKLLTILYYSVKLFNTKSNASELKSENQSEQCQLILISFE